MFSSGVQIPITVATQGGELQSSTANANIKTGIKPSITGPRKDTVQMTVSFTVSSVVGQNRGNPVISNRAIQTSLHIRKWPERGFRGNYQFRCNERL